MQTMKNIQVTSIKIAKSGKSEQVDLKFKSKTELDKWRDELLEPVGVVYFTYNHD